MALQIWTAEEEHFRFPGLKSCWKHNHNRMKKEKKKTRTTLPLGIVMRWEKTEDEEEKAGGGIFFQQTHLHENNK
jgi:hypothetical protein